MVMLACSLEEQVWADSRQSFLAFTVGKTGTSSSSSSSSSSRSSSSRQGGARAALPDAVFNLTSVSRHLHTRNASDKPELGANAAVWPSQSLLVMPQKVDHQGLAAGSS